jgi:antibiotic biosynthesis monooxygenase (ABM) superfamily enzyme
MPIQLHVDLEVASGRESALVEAFHKTFEPVIRQQPGFVSVQLVSFRQAMKGDPPAMKFRLLITFETEEQRLVWVASDDHQRVWPAIEANLSGEKYVPVLYDVR